MENGKSKVWREEEKGQMPWHMVKGERLGRMKETCKVIQPVQRNFRNTFPVLKRFKSSKQAFKYDFAKEVGDPF